MHIDKLLHFLVANWNLAVVVTFLMEGLDQGILGNCPRQQTAPIVGGRLTARDLMVDYRCMTSCYTVKKKQGV